MWVIRATPLAWRFRGRPLPSTLYRTRAGWTPDESKALRLSEHKIARIELHCVKVPQDYSAAVHAPTDGS